jgi:hypothetical protein
MSVRWPVELNKVEYKKRKSPAMQAFCAALISSFPPKDFDRFKDFIVCLSVPQSS